MKKFIEFMIVQIIFLTLLFIRTTSNIQPKIFSILSAGKNADLDELITDIPVFPSGMNVQMYVYGEHMTTDLQISITNNDKCDCVVPAELRSVLDTEGKVGLVSFNTRLRDSFVSKNHLYHLCILDPKLDKWVFQGSHNSISFSVYDPMITPFILVIITILCFALSALMSGLNISLMALNPQELELLKKVGTDLEKKYVKKIIPVRKNGNYLLCSILVTATLCNAVSTVTIDKFVTSELAIIISTIVIVLFCEIVPQVICRYFPLSTGAKTIYITKSCMVLTAPVSYPLGMLLNYILGKELTSVYTKERLKELVKMTELPASEGKIIEGTLKLSQKKVEDIMTTLDNIFKLPITGVMSFEVIELILESGFSRIPIYVENDADIRYILLTKDLAVLDPDANIPISVLAEHTKTKCKYIPSGTTLDSALLMFKDSRWHMAFIVDETFSPDKEEKKVLGLITFEDILEEIFQAEITDETDTGDDNKNNLKLLQHFKAKGLLSLMSQNTGNVETPSENLRLAAFHFLSGIDIFSVEYISRNVLSKLLKLDIFYSTHGLRMSIVGSSENIYVKGVPADYFIMILEGDMIVKVGAEGLKFEVGPFKHFGSDALKQGSLTEASLGFTPNFTLQATTKTMYLKISRVLYKAALLATNYERLNELPDINVESELYKYFNLLVENSAL